MNVVQNKDSIKRKIFKRFIQVILHFLFLAAVLFVSAGTMDWISAWVYLLIGVGSSLIATPILLAKNPEVIAERADMIADTKGWDRTFSLAAAIFTLAMLITAGLDQRFGWSSGFLIQLFILGGALLSLGYGLFFWALVSNKFFSRFVRIQIERDHRVVSSGPYQYVRHPGYSGMILTLLGTPLLLGSWWAVIPAILSAAAFVVRTSLEDHTLQEELEGYCDYADSVRYRLLPGVW